MAPVDVLISRYLDATASEAEIGHLDALIQSDLEVAREVFLAAGQDTAIREDFKARTCQNALGTRRNAGAATSRLSRTASSFAEERARRKKSRSRSYWPVWAVAVSAAIVIFSVLLWPSPPAAALSATVTETVSGVSIHRGSAIIVARQGTPLEVNDLLIVPPGESATVEYLDSVRVNIGAESNVVLGTRDGAIDESKTSLFLKNGFMTAKVDRGPTGREVVFFTPDTEAVAQSASIKLRVSPEQTRMEVNEGQIRVSYGSGHDSLRIGAGEYGRMAPGEALVVRSTNAVLLNDGLMSYWSFDEDSPITVTDASGHNNTGTITRATRTSGKTGGALKFDGNSHVSVPGDKGLNLIGEVSVSAWIKLSEVGRDQKIACIHDSRSGGYKFGISRNNKINLEIRDAHNICYSAAPDRNGTTLARGAWYHVVGVYSDPDHFIRMYVNGKLDAEVKTAGCLSRTTGDLFMGCDSTDLDLSRLNGVIDEMRIYNRALNTAEIRALAGIRPDAVVIVPQNNASPVATRFLWLDRVALSSQNQLLAFKTPVLLSVRH